MRGKVRFARLSMSATPGRCITPVRRLGRVLLPAVICLLLIISGCRKDRPLDHSILILYAFDAEGVVINDKISNRRTETHLGRPVVLGELSGKGVILAESGIGMTNAAMTAQRMIDAYNPRTVVFTGIAGSVDSIVKIGDIVVCSEWITHDFGYIGRDGFRHRGILAYQPNVDSVVRTVVFPVDSNLITLAAALADSTPDLRKIGTRQPRLRVGGVGVSGNTFIDSETKRQWLSHEFDALVTDMESAAVAQVCTVNKIPFIIFRSSSDLAGGSGSATARDELERFFEVAADNSARVVLQFVAGL
ncbi:MAG: 5'-methylthioadenosine/S-adenosylhomocysteine nucleosidase [bacterium]